MQAIATPPRDDQGGSRGGRILVAPAGRASQRQRRSDVVSGHWRRVLYLCTGLREHLRASCGENWRKGEAYIVIAGVVSVAERSRCWRPPTIAALSSCCCQHYRSIDSGTVPVDGVKVQSNLTIRVVELRTGLACGWRVGGGDVLRERLGVGGARTCSVWGSWLAGGRVGD